MGELGVGTTRAVWGSESGAANQLMRAFPWQLSSSALERGFEAEGMTAGLCVPCDAV